MEKNKQVIGKRGLSKKLLDNVKFQKVYRIIEEFGEWECNCMQLGRELGVPESTVNWWKHKIIEDLGPVDVEKVGRNVEQAIKSNIKFIQRQLRKELTPRDRSALIRAYNDTIKTYGDHVEKWGYKKKIPDKVESDTELVIRWAKKDEELDK